MIRPAAVRNWLMLGCTADQPVREPGQPVGDPGEQVRQAGHSALLAAEPGLAAARTGRTPAGRCWRTGRRCAAARRSPSLNALVCISLPNLPNAVRHGAAHLPHPGVDLRQDALDALEEQRHAGQRSPPARCPRSACHAPCIDNSWRTRSRAGADSRDMSFANWLAAWLLVDIVAAVLELLRLQRVREVLLRLLDRQSRPASAGMRPAAAPP